MPDSRDTLYNTGVAFFHGITEINLDSVNPIKGNKWKQEKYG